MSAETVEDAGDTTKSLEGIQVFRIQETCELARVKREGTKVGWGILQRARTEKLCIGPSNMVHMRRRECSVVEQRMGFRRIGIRMRVGGNGYTGSIRLGAMGKTEWSGVICYGFVDG